MSDEDRQKWEARYADAADAPSTPSAHLARLSGLGLSGRALDIAGGAGRNAIWLAQQGLETTLVDISARALAIARERAVTAGVTLHTVCRDLDTQPLPDGPWDVILSFHFLERSLWPAMRAALAPGGWLLFVQPTVCNLRRHPRPPQGFLLAEHEGRAVAEGLEIVEYQEDWSAEGRHEAIVLARKSPSTFA